MTGKSHNHKSNQDADASDCVNDLCLLSVCVSVIDFHSHFFALVKLLAPLRRYRTFVSEDAGPNTLVATVLAKDPDGDGITYSITAGNEDGNFVIDSQKGDTYLMLRPNFTFASLSLIDRLCVKSHIQFSLIHFLLQRCAVYAFYIQSHWKIVEVRIKSCNSNTSATLSIIRPMNVITMPLFWKFSCLVFVHHRDIEQCSTCFWAFQ